MKQNFTLAEMQMALRIAGITPAPASPLAGVQPALQSNHGLVESLRQKAICDGPKNLKPEWLGTLATLANPGQQAMVHVEGGGSGRYYSGAHGVAAMVPAEDGQQRILGGLSVDSILAEIDVLLQWRAVQDVPPLRADLAIAELTTVAAIADACREEQLRAAIERRPAIAGRVTRGDAERQVAAGQSTYDPRWLVSVLHRFAPQGCGPVAAALDEGASALVRRGWAKPGDNSLEFGPEIQALCDAFANVIPFLAIGVGAPWAEPAVMIFTRGWRHFCGIEFLPGAGDRRATLSHVGGKGMEEALRRHLAAFAPPSVARAGGQFSAGAAGPLPPKPAAHGRPAKAAAPGNFCRSCGQQLKPGKKFCTACGAAIS